MQLDISQELIIAPHLRGIKVCKPSNSFAMQTRLSIGEILKFPCNVYMLDTESKILQINEYSASTSGYESTNDAIGRTVFDVLTKENAKFITQTDKKVIQTKSVSINDDVMVRRNDEAALNFITVKVPIYNEYDDKVLGIFGCSVLLEGQPLAQSLNLMAKIGLLSGLHQINDLENHFPPDNIKVAGLSNRQSEIVYYLMRGYSAKKTGDQMGISGRTVEHYIENIKNKLHVSTKTELLERIIQLQDSKRA